MQHQHEKKASTWPSNTANKEHGPNISAKEEHRPNNTWKKNTHITQMKSMNIGNMKEKLETTGKWTLKAHKNTKKKGAWAPL